MTETSLVTPYTFNGAEYLIKMLALERSLEIVVTDKTSGEEWDCNYDMTCDKKTYLYNYEQCITFYLF